MAQRDNRSSRALRPTRSSRPARSLRTALAALTSVLLLPIGAGVAAAAQDPGPAALTAAERKIEPKLRAQLDDSAKAAFWVYLDSAADLTAAGKQQTRAAKAETVLRIKKDHAARSQADVIKALQGAGADYTSYWIVNAVRVVGSQKLAGSLAQRPEVARIDADDKVALPKPAEGKREKAVADAIEWNIDRIKAPQVWDQVGVRGEGIVVANIDSGVDYTHPAVNNQYRGKKADGTYDHAYNWFDPAGVCTTAAPATTTTTAPTPWARWSATTAAPTRSAWPPAPSGSRPRAVSRTPAPRPRSSPRASGSSPRPIRAARTRAPTSPRTS